MAVRGELDVGVGVGEVDGFGEWREDVDDFWCEADGSDDVAVFGVEAFEGELEVAVFEFAAPDAAVAEAGGEGGGEEFGRAWDYGGHGVGRMAGDGGGGQGKTNVA